MDGVPTEPETSVSVVIPAYNSAEYLREAIESVLAQTHQPQEIIVVDDGSTDHTRQVCASFGDRVKYYYQRNDGTMGAGARARGILEAKGDLIAVLDQDDRWLPTKLEKQYDILATLPAVGAAFTGFRNIDPDGRIVGSSSSGGPSGDVFHELLGGCPYCNSSGLIRRSTIARVGLPDAEVGAADWDLWLRIARLYPIVVVEECLTEYRIHPNNYSQNRSRLARAIKQVLNRQEYRIHPGCYECRSSLRKGWSFYSMLLAIGARQYLDSYHEAARTGQLQDAVRFLRQALQTDPLQVLRPRRFLAVFKSGLIGTIRGAKSGSVRSESS